MKNVLLLAMAIVFIFLWTPSQSQMLFEENFNYPAGDSLDVIHGWGFTSSYVNPILVTSFGLSYTGYPSSGIGNAAALVNTGQDLNDTLATPVSSGNVYASFLVRVDTARTGDYFFHLQPTSAPTTGFYARVSTRKANNGNLAFGLSKTSTSASIPIVYSDSVYSTGTTYLIVVKYAFSAATTTDDAVSLFVFSDPTLPSSEPGTPTVGPVTSTQTDATDIKFLGIRQGTASSSPHVIIDGIRVGTDWIYSPLPIQLASFNGRYNALSRCVDFHFRTISETNNFGFYLQRSPRNVQNFVNVSAFIPGHGTTNQQHDYTVNDCSVTPGTWLYRLAQQDLDATINYSEPIEITALTPTTVGESAPKVFALQQNYPNPFNPETNIRFSVEATAKTTLSVFNLIGQQVTTLFNDVAEAGKFYDVKFNGAALTSGVYFYKLESGTKSALKKLMLIK